MPELPDVVVYCDALNERIDGEPLLRVRIVNPFVLRTVEPPLSAIENQRVRGVRRLGKRIVIAFDNDLVLVVHLMVAGRFRWLKIDQKPPGRITLALFDFPKGTLALTEAGTKRRASLHVVRGAAALAAFDMGGLEVLGVDFASFATRLRAENHTLKRVLTDPHILSGIGNAYSDEILHRAQLSPIAHTQKLTPEQVEEARKRISQALGRDAVVHVYVDERIIGGSVLRVGDKLIDASVKTQLEAMRHQLLSAGRR